MIELLLDTHTLIWLLHGDERLSSAARRHIELTSQNRGQSAISSISLVEIAYLEEKGRIPIGTLQGTLAMIDMPNPLLVEIPLNKHIVGKLLLIPKQEIPEIPDRIIAATALYLNVPLITHDHKIQNNIINTVW
ncbi:MAG: type II toxin-antitoxin system VapC family toxin [Caldilineaceae bacterium]|nr:type II toxin-antitoxin system VapC family toxin [Caldilineaceae bacterium]